MLPPTVMAISFTSLCCRDGVCRAYLRRLHAHKGDPPNSPIDKALALLWYDQQGYNFIVVVCFWGIRDSEIAASSVGMTILAN